MGKRKYSDEDLIEHFMRVWAELGHQPSSRELARFSPPSTSTYLRRFGSWVGFLSTLGLAVPGKGTVNTGVGENIRKKTRGKPLPFPVGARKAAPLAVDTSRKPALDGKPFVAMQPKAIKVTKNRSTRFRLTHTLAATLMLTLCLGLALTPGNCSKPYLPGNPNPELSAKEEPLAAPYITEVMVFGETAKVPTTGISSLENYLFATLQFPERPPVTVVEEVVTQAGVEEVKETPQTVTPAAVTAAPATTHTEKPAKQVPEVVVVTAEPVGVETGEGSLEVPPTVVVAAEVPEVTTPGEALIPAEKIEVAIQAKEDIGVPDDTQTMIMAVTEANVFTAALPEPNGEAAARRKIITTAAKLLGRAYSLENPNPPESFTCSIFVEYCLKQVGLEVPAPSKTQWTVLDATKCGLEEALPYLVPGDVVFFVGAGVLSNGQVNPPPGHVGIYVGDGKFIHAAGHDRGVVMDNLLYRHDFWGWGSITPLLLEKIAKSAQNSAKVEDVTL